MLPKPATAMGQIGASLPPANTTSISPRAIRPAAAPIASAPLEQDDTVQKLGPRAPVIIDRWAAAMSPSIMGIRKGETRRGPREDRTLCWLERVRIPPMPLPTMTDMRYLSTWLLLFRLAWASASWAAAAANWVNRSVWRACFLSMWACGSNPFTSAAIWVLKPAVSKAEIRSTPDVPDLMPSQVEGASRPCGLTIPKPVTNTRFCSLAI